MIPTGQAGARGRDVSRASGGLTRLRIWASRLFLALSAVALLFLVLIALNLLQWTPLHLYRFRETSLALYGFLALAVLAAPKPRDVLEDWLARIRTVLGSRAFAPAFAAILAILFIAATLTRHWAFNTYSHDFSMFDEVLYQTHHGRILHSPILGRSFLSEHFSPLLLLLVPLHAAMPSPYLLLVLHALALAAASLLLRRILLDNGSPLVLANLVFAVWPLHPIATSSLQYPFHIEILLPALVFLLFLAYNRRNPIWYWPALLAVLAVKEDVGFYIAGFGVWAALADRRWKRGAGTVLVGLAWSLLAMKVLIPHFWPEDEIYPFLSRWEHWGSSPLGILAGYLSRPLELFGAMFNEDVIQLMAGMLFLPLLSGWAWFMVLPPWIINTTSNLPVQARLGLYYGLPLLAFSTVAAVIALRNGRLRKFLQGRLGICLAALLVVLNVSSLTYPRIDPNRPRFLEGLDQIPAEFPVQSMSCFYPVLGYEREKSLIRTEADSLYAPFLLLRIDSRTWPLSSAQAARLLRRAQEECGYTLVFEAGASKILRRPEESTP